MLLNFFQQRSLFTGARRHSARAVVTLSLSLLFPATEFQLFAQSRKKPPAAQTKSAQAKPSDELARSRDEFVKATKEYKKSLEQLIAIYEKNVSKAEEKSKQMKELYAQGIVSKHEMEEAERAVLTAQAKVTESKQQMVAADTQVAEMLVEEKAMEQMARLAPVPKGKLVQTTSYVRYNGGGAWSLSDAWKVQSFFMQNFKRQLPISTFGQGVIHNRWGLDHRNAMDVGVNPDSAEGQALMAFLRSNGIPFSAFRAAIPGAATGPHIHVGRPSHRTSPAMQ
ncbi:MAG: TolC family protein [Pyrinomonadaceae bacterium]